MHTYHITDISAACVHMSADKKLWGRWNRNISIFIHIHVWFVRSVKAKATAQMSSWIHEHLMPLQKHWGLCWYYALSLRGEVSSDNNGRALGTGRCEDSPAGRQTLHAVMSNECHLSASPKAERRCSFDPLLSSCCRIPVALLLYSDLAPSVGEFRGWEGRVCVTCFWPG